MQKVDIFAREKLTVRKLLELEGRMDSALSAIITRYLNDQRRGCNYWELLEIIRKTQHIKYAWQLTMCYRENGLSKGDIDRALARWPGVGETTIYASGSHDQRQYSFQQQENRMHKCRD